MIVIVIMVVIAIMVATVIVKAIAIIPVIVIVACRRTHVPLPFYFLFFCMAVASPAFCLPFCFWTLISRDLTPKRVCSSVLLMQDKSPTLSNSKLFVH